MATFRGPLIAARRERDQALPISLERWCGFALIVAAHAIEQRYAAAVRRVGISLRDYVLLGEIAKRPGLSQTALSARVGLGRSRVSEQLAVLSLAGYVERELNELDLRKRRLWVTAEGQRALEDAAERISDVDAGWLSVLEPGERHVFTAALRRLPPACSGRRPRAPTSAGKP